MIEKLLSNQAIQGEEFMKDFLDLNLYKNFKYSKKWRIRKKQIKFHAKENARFYHKIITLFIIGFTVREIKKRFR